MLISIYRLKVTISNLINLEYDSNKIPILTDEDFKTQYKLLGSYNIDYDSIDFENNSVELYNKLKQYNINLKIGDIISCNADTYYYDHPLVKFYIF